MSYETISKQELNMLLEINEEYAKIDEYLLSRIDRKFLPKKTSKEKISINTIALIKALVKQEKFRVKINTLKHSGVDDRS